MAATLKSNHICSLSENTCRGSFNLANKYIVKCDKSECNKKYEFKCSSEYCTVNSEHCTNFHNLKVLLKTIMKSSRTYEKYIAKYMSFIKGIQNCSESADELQSNDICMNGMNCFVKKPLKLRYSGLHLYNRIECPCSELNSYQCGMYCTVHKNVCLELNTNATKLASMSSLIKKCGNDNTILEAKKSFFF